jgi:hypothetical protein
LSTQYTAHKSARLELAVSRYIAGESIPQIADDLSMSRSTLRYHLHKRSVLRSRDEAVRMAAKEGRLGSGTRGKSRHFTQEHCNNISRGRIEWANAGNCAGVSLKPSGYIEYTRGPHKSRSVHVVAMEKRLGRRLLEDECVHHIDGNKTNNQDNNLALVTRSGHSRLHRREERLIKKSKESK